MELSIIVPVYNMAANGKLAYCMDSLVRQTLNELGIPYEILAVDDASTDNSLEILRSYEASYPGKVRVFHYAVNRKQGGAKNEGLRHAEGRWIGFIDSDDWVSPDYYEKLLNKAYETGADMVGCNYSLVNEHTYEVGKIVANNSAEQTGVLDEARHKLHVMRPGSMVIKIYRREVIEENKLDFPENIFYEDNCAGTVWSLYFKHFEKVEEPLYYYYQHDASTVHYITEEKCRNRVAAALLLYDECKKRGAIERYPAEIEYRFTEIYYVNTVLSYMQGAKHPGMKFLKELRDGQREHFPNYAANAYYRKNTGTEEQYWMSLLDKNVLGFYLYYRLKFFVRKVKKSIRK